MSTNRWQHRIAQATRLIGLGIYAGLVVLIFVCVRYVLFSTPEPFNAKGELLSLADRSTISLNALGLAIVTVTIFIGVLAVVGWDKLEKIIRRDVEDSLRDRLSKLEMEMHGRVMSMLGFAIGELSTEPDQEKPTNPARLAESLAHCERGYKFLAAAADPERRGPMLTGLNNLVYYSSIYGDRTQGRKLLQQAHQLRAAGDEFSFPTYHLTFCRAVLSFSLDRKEIAEALAIVSELLASSRQLTSYQLKEANFYVQALNRKLESLDAKIAAP